MTENKETLVKNYSFKELVDVKTLQSFTDTLYSAFRLPSAIVTTDGEILTGSGWQKICTDFHRKNPESEKDCIESDTCLTKMIGEGKKYCIYKCPRGLVDSSSPVIVDGVHVANVFTGQFFSVSPTKETEKLFRKQAETFGFDQKAYMKAFKSIPVFPEEKHLLLLDVLVNLASMLSEIGLTRKRELDKTKQVLVSEEKFRKYISHAPDGIFIVDARGFYVEVNQAACKLTGYSESELTSMSIPDIVASDDDIPSESLKDLQKSGSVKLEFRLRRKDGTIIWASLEAVTISEDRFMAFCSDITERKLAGDELLRERNILQEVMNGAKDIHLVYLDRDFNFVRVNKTYSDTCGYKPNEMIGKNHFDLYPNAENEAIFKKVRDTGEPFHIKDKPFSFPDQPELGVTYWDWSLCPVKGKQGDVEGLIFSLVETTKRKQTENSLRESEERLHQSQVIAGIGDFIWDIPSGKATWSEGMYELLKYDKNEIIDYEKVNVAIHHPDDLERVTKWLTDNLAYGQEILTPNEYRLICKDGEVIHVQTNGRIDYRDGKAIKLFGTCIDITERKLAEKKLTATTTFLDRIVDMSPFAMWVSNSEGVMIRSNRSLRDTMGLTDEQLIGNYNVLKDENLVKQNLMPQVKSVFEKHEAVRFDMIWNVSDSGGIKFDESHNYHIDVSLFPVVDSDGKLVNIVCQWVDITERKQIENKIVKLNNELQNSIANMPNAYILWDLDLKILEWNKAAERIFGYTKEEMLGKNAADFIVPEDVRHLVGDVLLKLQVGDVADYSEKDNNIRKDGSLISCQWHNTPLIDANGKVYAILTLAQDITERKKAEEKILQNKVLLESSLESQKDTIILSLDREYRYLYFNKAHSKSMINAYGTKPELGLSIFDIIQVDEDIVRLKAHYDRALTGDRHTIIEDYGGEDSRLFFEINFNPIYDNNKKIIGLSVFAQDITERKRAEVALRENDEKLRTYISSAPDGIFIINSDAKFIEVNDTGCKIMGYPESELLQLSPIDVLDPEYIEKFKNNFDILKEKGSSKGEYKVITKSGKLIWISIDAVALSKDEVMAFGSDISETKRLQELESRAERLETAGTIAGQVAHDFNNLLAPMVAYPEFIRDELPDDHPTLKYLDQIEQAAQKIADINQQLLTLGRRGHYNQDVINLNTIINQAIMDMPRPADGVTRETNLEPDLMNILGGGSQIHRVITNLLYNSADALQGIGHINIKTENYYADDVSGAYGRVPKGEYVKLTISDSGCGISDDIVQKILDPFFSTKTSDKKRGSGLGLSVVDAVIKDHNGYLDLKTQSGKGTSFYIYFPTTRKLSDNERPDKTIGGKETILIVDDDDMQREVSTKLLKKLGYKVNSVDSGEKAIKFLRKNPHELLILDMVMPGGIDGAETLRQILKISPNQKAIIVSGFSESDRVKVAQELGAGVFVKKPLSHKAIASAVRIELDKPEMS